MARTSRRFAVKIRRWGRRVKWAQRLITSAPRSVRIAGIVAVVLATLASINLIVQVVRKPTELLFFVGHRLNPQPRNSPTQLGPPDGGLSLSRHPSLPNALADPIIILGIGENRS
jgi:hypothetical protein